MRTDLRTGLMRKYFLVYGAEYPSFSNIIRISLGLMLFGVFIMFSFENTTIAGLIFILVGFTLFFLWIRPYFRDLKLFRERPSDSQIHNWFIEDLNEVVKTTAIEKLRLNIKTLQPEHFLLIPYPVYWNVPGFDSDMIMRRMNDTGNFSYTVWNVQVLALTENYISFYHCTYDWLNNNITHEKTNEFFYEDISSVKNGAKIIERYYVDKEYTDEEGNRLDADKLTATIFKVTNMSSESLKVITNIMETNHAKDVVVNLEKAVQALRVMLRKRRFDEDQEPIIIESEDFEENEETEENIESED